MPANNQTLVDDYERAVAEHGIFSDEARAAAIAKVAQEGREKDKWAYETFLVDQTDQAIIALGKKEKREKLPGYKRRIKLLGNAKSRRFLGSYWAEDKFRTYQESVQTSGENSPQSKTAYTEFLKSVKSRSALGAAPPKHPELEETRGAFFGALLASESAVGTAMYEARKKKGYAPIDWIEQTESEELLKEISPSQAMGFTTRETPLFSPRGIIGLGIDIRFDPLTYVKFSAKLLGRAGETLLIKGRGGEKVVTTKKGIEILERQTQGIREAFPGVSADEARRAAENLVVGLTKRREELVAARKYQERSFSFADNVGFYWSDVQKRTDKLWKAAPMYSTRTWVVSQLRETFEPYYKVKKAADDCAKDVFAGAVRESEYSKDVWSKQARDLSKQYPSWFRKKHIADVDMQVTEFIERGIEPTEPFAKEIAESFATAQRQMAEMEMAEGILTGTRKGYAFHAVTKEFKEDVLAKQYVMPEGGDPLVYLKKLQADNPRMMEGSIKEINEWSMKKYGIKALETHVPRILELRGVASSTALSSSRLGRNVGEELGIPAEQMFPLAGRKSPKFTPEEIGAKAEAKYGDDIEALRETLGIPEGVEIRTAADVARYAKREGIDIDAVIKSIDDQITEAEAKLEAGIWRTTDEGVLGVRPGVPVTTIEAHITASGRKAQESLIDLERERSALRVYLETPSTTEFESVEDVMQALASGKGYDLAKLQYAPKKMTAAAKAAQNRADRYRATMSPFYNLFEQAKKGTLTEHDIKAVEHSIADESGGLFKGMRYGKADSTIGEYMEMYGMESAREAIYYKRHIDDHISTIDALTKSIEHSRSRISGLKDNIADLRDRKSKSPRTFDIEGKESVLKGRESALAEEQSSLLRLETDIADEQVRLATKEEEYETAIRWIQESKSGVKTEVIEPAYRKISHLESVAGKGTTQRIDWGTGLPTDIGTMPLTASPLKWMCHATEQITIQKKIDKLDVSIAAKKAVIEAQTKPAVESATYKKLIGETEDLVGTREQIVKFYNDYSSLSPEELAKEASRISKLPGVIGEDKAMFESIAGQQVTRDTLATTISKRDADIQKWKFTSGKPGALPEAVMVDGKMLVKHQYAMRTGEVKTSYIAPEVKDELERSMSVVMKRYDEAMRVVRYGYTMPWPAFHMRNIQGIIWQNRYAGVKAEDYDMAFDILYGDQNKIIDLPVYGKMKVSELRQMLDEAGVTGKTGYVQESQHMMGAGIVGKKAIEWPAGSMVAIENVGRTSVAINRLKRGESIDIAAEWARKLHFEYGVAGMTPREQAVFRRAALFYTWPKKNIGLSYRMAAEQPGTALSAVKAQQMMITPEEYEMLPHWAKDSYVIASGGSYYVLEVPFIEGLQPWNTISFMHSPALKFYTSAVSGYDWETGQPIGVGDLPALAARSFGGRFQTTYANVMKAERGDITTKQLAIHQVGGVYARTLDDLPLETAYWAMKRYTWKPRKEDYLKAFEESGQLAEHYETLWTPPSVPKSEAFIEGKKWWQQPYLTTSPLKWGEFSSKDQYVGETGIVVGYTQEEWEVIGGHTLTDSQREEVHKIYKTEGATEAALARVRVATLYHAARAAFAGKKPVTPDMIIDAYTALIGRVGVVGAMGGGYKTFYTEEGEPSIIPLTEEELEEWGSWKPSAELVKMFTEKKLTPEEERYNKMVQSANMLESMTQATSHVAMMFPFSPFEAIEPHGMGVGQHRQISEYLQKLKKETGFIPSGAQIDWAATTDWLEIGGERKKMGFKEQMKHWSQAYEIKQDQDRLLREEYAELVADPRGTTKRRKDDYVPMALTLTRGGENIGIRRERKQELEDMLGVGVDR